MIILVVILWVVKSAALSDGPPVLKGFLPSPYELIPLGDATSIGDGDARSLNEVEAAEYGETVTLASKSGSRMVVGAPAHSPDGEKVNAGRIFLYDYSESENRWDLAWSLTGSSQNEKLGSRLSLSGDGTRLAVRRYNPNRVVIFEIDAAHNGLVTRLAELNEDQYATTGDTVTLSPDGSTLAVSDESWNGFAGRVAIFHVEEDKRRLVWLHTIDGFEKQGRFGWMTSFSERGDHLVISAPNHDGKKGLVRAYKREENGSQYTQLGQDLVGLSARDEFGLSLMMNAEGTHLVASSPPAGGNGILRGTVTVWRFSAEEDIWIQVGNSINGPVDRDRLGRSVSISADGQTIATTSYLHDSIRGWARVFYFVSSENTWRVVGTVKGKEYDEKLGFGLYGMSMTDDSCRIAVGSVMDEGFPSGKAQLYQLVNHRSEAPSASPSVFLEAHDSDGHRWPQPHTSRPSMAPTGLRTASSNQPESSISLSGPRDDQRADGFLKDTTMSGFPVLWVILLTVAGAVFVCCCWFCFGRIDRDKDRDEDQPPGMLHC